MDACAGGLSVALSSTLPTLANDYCYQLIEIYTTLSNLGRAAAFEEIFSIIDAFDLDKENAVGFEELKEGYNTDKDPLLLLVLMYHSFSNQIRFNASGDFTMAFGRRTFNPSLQNKLNIFFDVQESSTPIKFSSCSFIELDIQDGDFVYIDPPYKITDATYNVYWSEDMDTELMAWLDSLDRRGIKWAMSNVFRHRGKTNEPLIEWSESYNTHVIDGVSYVSGSYRANNMEKPTVEVLITNY